MHDAAHDTPAIADTARWLEQVVIGHNLCPFAQREWVRKSVRLISAEASPPESLIMHMLDECAWLDEHPDTETTLMVLEQGAEDFESYLFLVEAAEHTLAARGYEGIYQVASFHPEYCFAGEPPGDASNYTNRSPWPLLHLLREDSLERALAQWESPDDIYQRNIAYTREKGAAFWQALMAGCRSR
ncbi:DUF1415 domain-containing protein [Larsenimonas rhizosphaerae]|uniref:DUF1415 domain-containing protein n=1 Tax=Larsenimonas rhizosphaerae TaxID=2944682 RepID=A0AA41ZEB6_9GAMM|nr:DUF1415 domain-containing protein [Larsenimonas rhizosphaerae]MCX2523006.1 DUF1415 domain-containing protein [Larsenimonas rhizosphaerae]